MSDRGSLVPLGSSGTALAEPSPFIQPAFDVGEVKAENGFFAALSRNRWIVAALLVAGIATGLALAYVVPPTYRAQAQIELEQAAPAAQDGTTGKAAPSTAFMDAQLSVLRSRALASDVVETLHLDGNAQVAKALGVRATAPAARKAELERRIHDSVQATGSSNSGVVTISADSKVPSLSALLANGYVNTFATTSLARQDAATQNARHFLDQKLAETKAKLGASEKALIDYTRASNLIDPTAGTASVSGDAAPHSLASDDLTQVNQSYSQARADRIAAEQRWRAAQSTPLMSLPEVLGNPAIQQLSQKLAEAQAAYQEQRQHRLDSHPDVEAAAAQITEAQKQIQALAQSIKDSLHDKYDTAVRQEQDLSHTVGQLQSQTLADQGKGVEYNRLKRDADSNRQLYSVLLQRSNDANTAAGLIASNVSVIDPAVAPDTPYSPNPVLWTGLGALGGLLLGLVWVLLAWRRDDRLRSPESVGAALQLRVLGVLPRVKHPAEALLDPRSPLSEAHYALRGSLEGTSTKGLPKAIAFTSSREAEGKTTAAVGVARDFALSGRRTLIIDGDMRKPSVHKYVDGTSALGLSTVLADLSTPEAAIARTSTPGLSVMFAGPSPASPAALLSGRQLKQLLNYLSKQYDVIIFDAPPVFGLADAPRIAAAVQRTVFVVEAGRAKIGDVRGAIHRLMESRAKFAGIVLTKFDVSRSGSASNLYLYEYGERRRTPRLQSV
ncbi:polysaccharide biosynthesis tyrosine autokinase [Sphingomonas sp.]|uniref:GumC family protein n=1 Tax=Sphingomonas sp. TaxID=28214 RepID=UPI0025D00027|nr:polysaccharide biosynthesis tyrosine autokinase [Sphingomonas sp.]MBV9526784.1 polysaccharide biosynthesis tyrosine autokinase [Sphingomonas sp.]